MAISSQISLPLDPRITVTEPTKGKSAAKSEASHSMYEDPGNSIMTSCDKIYSTNSHNLSRNDAISTSSTPTSSGETQPPNISESSHEPNATDSSSTNAS